MNWQVIGVVRDEDHHECGPAGARAAGALRPGRTDSCRKVTVVMPTQGAVPAPLPGPEAQAARELLPPAEQVHLLPYDPDDRAARIWADEQIIAMSRCLGAVWNGSAPIGRDATGHLVAYARARSVPVSVVWPVGAGRRESDR